MKTAPKETGRKFVQVSLPQEFAADVRAHSAASDRSMAAQLEHWAKVARAMEQVVPAATLAELKSSQGAADVLTRLVSFLMPRQGAPSPSLDRLAAAKSPRYGVDDNDPQVAVRIDPDGTQTRGVFDTAGNFVPTSTASSRKTNSDARRSKSKPAPATTPAGARRKAAASTRSSRGHSGASAPA